MQHLKYRKTYKYLIAWSKRFQGLGLLVDFDNPEAHREIVFTIRINILWFKFWMIKYKSLNYE